MSSHSARQEFQRISTLADEEINLTEAALYIAQEEYPEIVIAHYLHQFDQWAAQLQPYIPRERYPLKVIQTVNHYLYDELGFRGNTTEYYDPRNSFLSDVCDRRTGIPITLALVYLELARRIGFPMIGIGMPGHFLIRPNISEMEVYVDAFHRGEILFVQDCQTRLTEIYGQTVSLESLPLLLEKISAKRFLARMLTNLKMIYLERGQLPKALAAVDRILLLFPETPIELRDRGLIYYQLEQWQFAMADLEKYLHYVPRAGDAEAIQRLLERIREP